MRRAPVRWLRRCAIEIGLVPVVLSGCQAADPGPGVSETLARERAATIGGLRYDVHITIPEKRTDSVTGRVEVTFTLDRPRRPLILDFRAPPGNLRSVSIRGRPVPFATPEDHVVIPRSALVTGQQTIALEFVATEAALNRQDDFLYTLFVPDRASTAFPVFDQPDLKARFRLSLDLPAGWTAVSNGSIVERDSTGPLHRVRFVETAPISTYLFAFAAGVMKEERAVRNGRPFTLYHRETDTARLGRNRDAIFDLHAAALRSMEDYTGIPYPFEKFDFVAIPAFQFGGMEHPGAVWYRAEAVFLDPAANRNQELGRASVIAHETAHMWFGDLVTMRWFDDVWVKEVFANFMAAKLVGPSFPDMDLDLRFFLAHHPAAYAVDRTSGTNAIRQRLENLREAGSLYGAIIYQKAPIVMKQLERVVGEETFRDGLRRYLARFQFGNASWLDLVAILDDLAPDDVAAWSRAWIEEPGRPTIAARWADSGLVISQSDPVRGRDLRWIQDLALSLGAGDSAAGRSVQIRERDTFLPFPARPDWVALGTDGVTYGRFALDSASRARLLARVREIEPAVGRSVVWQTLFEEMLDGLVPPERLLEAALAALPREQVELVSLQLVNLIGSIYWRFVPATRRTALAPTVEGALWAELDRAAIPGRKGAYWSAIVSNTLTPAGIGRLMRIWRREETVAGLPLAEAQYVELAEALALRSVPGAEAMLDEQEAQVSNPDRLARLRFVRPALSADPAVRDSLFRTFSRVAARRRESWVLDAMGAMNHPLRASEALPNLRASLELGEEIQRAGDIFFPLRWFHAVLDGHQSAAAADTVAQFLADVAKRRGYPARLRGKLLQAADGLFRAAAVVEGRSAPPRDR